MTSLFSIALHSVVYLTEKEKIVTSEMLAENINSNPVRIRMIMSQLVKAKIIKNIRGVYGGYYCDTPASEIKLVDIAKALNIDFVNLNWKLSNKGGDIPYLEDTNNKLDGIFSEMNKKCYKYLTDLTIADLLK